MAEFKVTSNAPEWLQAIREKQRPVTEAAVAALQDTAENAVAEGRQDIASAGRFGTKWQQGLKFSMKDEGLQSEVTIFHTRGLSGVFEHGLTISGNPLLWIPTRPDAPSPKRSGKKLVSATVRGQPLLFDATDRDRHRKPLYIGVRSARIPKLWHVTEIVKQHAERLGKLFLKHFKDD